MNKLPLLLLLLCFSGLSLMADEQVDLDALFDAPPAETDGAASDDSAEEEPDILKELSEDERFSFKARYNFSFGYSPGMRMESDDLFDTSSAEFSDSLVYTASSLFSVDARLTPEFRVFQSFQLKHPDYELDVPEFFGDYTVADALFLRFGIQKIAWGISPLFPFTNLPARLSDDFDTTGDFPERSYSLKASLPVGIGGIEPLALTRNGFLADRESPSVSETGFGGKLNLAGSGRDLTLATFYHSAMDYRASYSFKTTIGENLELYQEGLWSYDVDHRQIDGEDPTVLLGGKEKADNQSDLSANIGFYTDFFNGRLKLQGEYFFNGEESELEPAGSAYPLYYGHNGALNLAFDVSKTTSLFLQSRYNQYAGSALIIPGVRSTPFGKLQFYIAAPLVIGPASGGYYLDNPDPGLRRFSLFLGARLSGTYIRNW